MVLVNYLVSTKKVLFQRRLRELRIHRGHFCLEVIDVLLTDGLCSFAFPWKRYPIRHVRNGVFASHAVVRIVGHESRLLPSCMMAGVIASDDRANLPPAQMIIKDVVVYANLAHEELKEFVDGGQFFTPSSSVFSSAGCSGFGSTPGTLKKSLANSMTVLNASTICL